MIDTLRVEPVVHGVRVLGFVSHMLSRAYRLARLMTGDDSAAWRSVYQRLAEIADLLACRGTLAELHGSEAARWIEVAYEAWPRMAVERWAPPSNGLLAALQEAQDEARKLADEFGSRTIAVARRMREGRNG